MSERVFRNVTPDEYRWQPELKGDPEKMFDCLWIDGLLDDGWQLGIGLFRSRALTKGMPGLTMKLISPTGELREVNAAVSHAEFRDDGGIAAAWGANNRLTAVVDGEGHPVSFALQLEAEGLQVAFECATVCTGVKFTSARPGFSTHDPEKGLAVGWWPLIPRATAKGRITLDGKGWDTTGLFYVERQVSSLPLASPSGEKTAQSLWTWGHFNVGDFTATWTDSGASEEFGYRHFTPFVMWKGSDPFLSTFAFASYVEKFAINPENGLAYPEVVTLKASGGDIEFFARMTNGRISEHVRYNQMPGAIYCRQVAEVHAQYRHWGKSYRLTGEAVHEWGTRAGNFPFPDA